MALPLELKMFVANYRHIPISIIALKNVLPILLFVELPPQTFIPTAPRIHINVNKIIVVGHYLQSCSVVCHFLPLCKTLPTATRGFTRWWHLFIRYCRQEHFSCFIWGQQCFVVVVFFWFIHDNIDPPWEMAKVDRDNSSLISCFPYHQAWWDTPGM